MSALSMWAQANFRTLGEDTELFVAMVSVQWLQWLLEEENQSRATLDINILSDLRIRILSSIDGLDR